MAGIVQTKNPTTVIATKYDNLGLIPIKTGQITIVTDRGMVCLDGGEGRSFMHGIEMINFDDDRRALENPIENKMYFVLETGIFWTYQHEAWVKLTHKPEEVTYIGMSLPEKGRSGVLYADRVKKELSVWDEDQQVYDLIANYCDLTACTDSDILAMFNN